MSLKNQMLQQAGYTSYELDQIGQEYRRCCGRSEVMSEEQFAALLTQLGCTQDQCRRWFRTLSTTADQNKISLEELTVGLCALDPNSPHSGSVAQIRCQFIFKFYNTSCSGRLSFDELREMMSDICAAKGLTLDLQQATNENWELFSVKKEEGISLEKFLYVVHQLKFRGTSFLFRLPHSPFVKKTVFTSDRSLSPVRGSGEVVPDILVQNEVSKNGAVGMKVSMQSVSREDKVVGVEGGDRDKVGKEVGEKGESAGKGVGKVAVDGGGEAGGALTDKGTDNLPDVLFTSTGQVPNEPTSLNLPPSVRKGLPESVLSVLPQVDGSELCSKDLFDVEAEVHDIAYKWSSFGKALHLTPDKLHQIEAKPDSERLSQTLQEFLMKNYDWKKYGVPSWRLIVIALAHKIGGENTGLALTVAKEHSTI